MKKTWSVINEIICKTKHHKKGIKAIIMTGKQLKDPQSIAESFNNFFVNIGPSLTTNARHILEKTFRVYLNKTILTSFDFQLIDESNFDKVIQSLHTKTLSCHDGISVKLLKYLAPALWQPLTFIINQLLLTGIFPEKLKIAKVLSLFKNMTVCSWTTTTQYHCYRPYQRYLKKLFTINYTHILLQTTYYIRGSTASESIIRQKLLILNW